MGTVIDYIAEYGDYTFGEKPLTEVDSLVFSQFSYLKFDGIVPTILEHKKAVTLQYLDQHQEKEKLFADKRFRCDNVLLFEAMRDSVRFGQITMNYYWNIIDIERETQFSAVTIFADAAMIYLAYRGTDETIVGWKEDLNLAFSKPVQGQLYSVDYMNKTANLFDGNFCTGGHSKGGNFAVYASMNCASSVRNRIDKIYNHDGPGFRPEIRIQGKYTDIAHKVVKVIPHSSVIGMVLHAPDEKYMVVESKTFGLLQHNPYSWLIKDGRFVKAKDIYKGSRFRDDTFNQWILSLEEDQIHAIVDTLYEVVLATEATTLIQFSENKKKSMKAIFSAIKGLDEEAAIQMKELVSSLLETAAERLKEELQGLVPEDPLKKKKRKIQKFYSPDSVQRERK